MAARKLQQEVDKCFKKVTEGVAEFEAIYEKIEQSNNAAQKEKLEDNLKREIKKLQRLRDQIKTWAASNDIKDKGPLLDNRKLIETQMEKFKAVEKAMKTKAYSKEGLSAAAKLDPKERAKLETCEFLNNQVDELERQIETLEAEAESIQATMKKGKNQTAKAERVAEIERITERHKWHQSKLELIKRSLENGGVETEQVNELEESIRYYVTDGMNDDFMEDEEMYDELNLADEEDQYGMNLDNDRVSSQDTQSIQDDPVEPEPRGPKAKAADTAARRPSTQLKSPLPALATLHTPLSTASNGTSAAMKPATVPARAPGETLKYASAAAAAASHKDIGIAPLPPPAATTTSSGLAPLPPPASAKGTTASPIVSNAVPSNSPAATSIASETIAPSQTKSPALSQASAAAHVAGSTNQSPKTEKVAPKAKGSKVAPQPQQIQDSQESSQVPAQTNGIANGVKALVNESEESIYHLPSALQDLVHSLEATRKRATGPSSQSAQRMLAASQSICPGGSDLELSRSYRPKYRFDTPSHYPKEPVPIFNDPRLYARIDPDTLFYMFYYKQGTYQQYLSAKALKDQSWRFHKQYQTWFQRHEEPKTITEEFEQGTYRFFDYESTWMNRRKADFKFAYKFLEDDV